MKSFVAPVVSEKVRTFEESLKRDFSLFLDNLSTLTPEQMEGLRAKSATLDRDRNIFSLRQGHLRVFYSTGVTHGEPYLLVLDVASAIPGMTETVGGSDPRINSRLNPYLNPNINPHSNPRLNPLQNPPLNPHLNPHLNPYQNPWLNPLRNPNLDFSVNAAINPLADANLNPRANSDINPLLNPRFDGLRFYDLNLFPQGFAIRATAEVVLRFSGDLSFTGVGVHNDINGYALFDSNNNWDGYLVPDEQGGYLNFDVNGAWRGLVTA